MRYLFSGRRQSKEIHLIDPLEQIDSFEDLFVQGEGESERQERKKEKSA